MGAANRQTDVRRLIAVMVAMGELVRVEDPDGTVWYIATDAFDRLLHADALALSGIELRAAPAGCTVAPREPRSRGSSPRGRRPSWRHRMLSALLGLFLVPAVGVTAWVQQQNVAYGVEAPGYHQQRAPVEVDGASR